MCGILNPIVYLIDDDAPYLRATSRMLQASGYSVRTYGSAQAFLSQLERENLGCVVTDLAMPEMDGIALQGHLNELGACLPVIFLSGQGDIPTTVRAMRGGAEDFLTKSGPGSDLIAAIDRGFARSRQMNLEVSYVADLKERFDALSPRELEVLRFVVAGRLNKQIAAELGIHERTVKFHRTSITTKLGVSSAAELATMAFEAGIIRSEHTERRGEN